MTGTAGRTPRARPGGGTDAVEVVAMLPGDDDRPALHLEHGGSGAVLTRRELRRAVAERAAALRRSMADGASGPVAPLLAVEGHRGAAVLVEVMAALEAGVAVVPLNAGWWPRERDAVLERLRPSAVAAVGDATHPVALRPGRPDVAYEAFDDGTDAGARAGAAALWLVSSGSEGDPTPYAFTAEQVRRWLDPDRRVEPGDHVETGGSRVVVCGDIAHAPVFRAALTALVGGAELTITDRLHLGAVITAAPVARLVTTPVLLRRTLHRLERRGRHPATVTRLLLHQGDVRPHEPDRWADRLGAEVQASVSATEAGGWLLHDGVPPDGIEVRLTDTGEVSCLGPLTAVAATGRPRPPEGWHGGDLAAAGDGRLRWLGRQRDRFTVDGTEVDPVAVEAALATHPLIAEVAVAPRPHPDRGNIAVAVIVPADPEWPPFLEDLADHVAGLGTEARPAALAVVDDLPVNAAGALHRRLVVYEEAGR